MVYFTSDVKLDLQNCSFQIHHVSQCQSDLSDPTNLSVCDIFDVQLQEVFTLLGVVIL